MKKPVRFLVYVGLLSLAWVVLSPALSINTAQIGAPVKALASGWSTPVLMGALVGFALLITYLITSGWGLILLGALALLALIVVSVLHPYLFPLLIPMFALWAFCAAARRKDDKGDSSPAA